MITLSTILKIRHSFRRIIHLRCGPMLCQQFIYVFTLFINYLLFTRSTKQSINACYTILWWPKLYVLNLFPSLVIHYLSLNGLNEVFLASTVNSTCSFCAILVCLCIICSSLNKVLLKSSWWISFSFAIAVFLECYTFLLRDQQTLCLPSHPFHLWTC